MSILGQLLTLRILKVRISGLESSQNVQGTFEIRRGAAYVLDEFCGLTLVAVP